MITRSQRTGIRIVLGVIGVVFLGWQIWRHGHDYVFPENFAVIEPGQIYRGAWQMSWPMERIVQKHEIKTVIALAHPPESPWVEAERRLGDRLGFRFVHLPIVEDRTDINSNKVLYDRLEEAAATVADEANAPVFFHCHHGVNRASMVHMAYRMIYCDYTIDEAEEEVAALFGLRKVNRGPDYRHMRGFYEERVLPKRVAVLADNQAQVE